MSIKLKIKATGRSASEMLNGGSDEVPMKNKVPVNSPESKLRESAGVEGSRLELDNDRQDYDHGTLAEYSPAVTDHKFESNARVDNRLPADAPERIRRINDRNRDVRNSRWSVFHGAIQVTKEDGK